MAKFLLMHVCVADGVDHYWLQDGLHKQQVEEFLLRLKVKTDSSSEDDSSVAKQGFGEFLAPSHLPC